MVACVWLQIIFCTCVKETVLFSFLRSLLRENGRSVHYRKWIPTTNDPDTANDPQNWPQMILDRKRSPKSTANDPERKGKGKGKAHSGDHLRSRDHLRYCTDRFASRGYSLKKKLGDRMIKQLLNSVIVKYRYFSVSRRSIISSPQTNHDILLNLVQQLLIIWRVSHFYRSIYRDVKNHKLTRKQEAFAPITGAS